jgi:predicted translation initiation factor SUI1
MSKMTDLSQLSGLLSREEQEKLQQEAKTLDAAKTLGNGALVDVTLDKVRRRGKVVTVISEIQHNPQVIERLAVKLKQLCGAGGTTRGKEIEIQGDHRTKVAKALQVHGFKVRLR